MDAKKTDEVTVPTPMPITHMRALLTTIMAGHSRANGSEFPVDDPREAARLEAEGKAKIVRVEEVEPVAATALPPTFAPPVANRFLSTPATVVETTDLHE